jgi:hypothetical protein
MTQRRAKLVPYYHVKKDQCEVDTQRGTQCKNSAGYIARSGMNGSSQELPVCKTHGDMLRLDPELKWNIMVIRERFVTI